MISQPEASTSQHLPADYLERVYAGVLGKLIGVYLGRPFEGWTHARILEELGEINYYVHERRGVPLVVTDDDITGTFTFLRALEDHGHPRDLSAKQIGQSWLNYTIEGKSIFWWGGLGNSSEHTAYLRLKSGVDAPESGSQRLNGKVISEQIGAQIFIDGWGMVAPGDPKLAASLAAAAGSVSHDGEAVYAAQVLAVMVSLAFNEPRLDALLDAALSYIPSESVIAGLIRDVRDWHRQEPDWHGCLARVQDKYGYDKYGGPCHVVPNHALVILGLLYGEDDFQKSLMITNTCGWDTDCNAGNVGCLLGIKNGLSGLEGGPDWRGPLADRLFLPTADPARGITDALTEAYHVTNAGRALAGRGPLRPKDGARFHFSLLGSVQGFRTEDSIEARGTLRIENAARGETRALALHYEHLATGRVARAATSTFIPPDCLEMPGYGLHVSPTLHSGQTLEADVSADEGNMAPVTAKLYLRLYGPKDSIQRLEASPVRLESGARETLRWTVPDTGGRPIFEVGLELSASDGSSGCAYLERLNWGGAPRVTLTRPEGGGKLWHRAWVDGVQQWEHRWAESFRVVQNSGRGLIAHGGSGWTDYRASASLTPALSRAFGLAVRVAGLRRYDALLLTVGNRLKLVQMRDTQTTLAEIPLEWSVFEPRTFQLEAHGSRLRAWMDGRLVFDLIDPEPLTGGGVGLVIEEGTVSCDAVHVGPVGA